MTTAAKPRRWTARRILLLPFKLLFWFVIVSIGWVVVTKFVPPPITLTMMLNGDGISKDWTSLRHIDRNMVSAAIAAEDGKFCTHDGFDREAIEQAIKRNKSGKRLRGGSTISQQTAKNVFLWQGTGWTRYVRKVPEVWFTFLIENIWGKRRIMEVYLNVAETGIGTYGVEAGAQRYFKHGAGKMTRDEASRIAAILPLPQKRGAISPTGFTRRYGNNIERRIGVVRREGFDACIYK